MTKSFKRIIAREFLYLLSAIILWLAIVSIGLINKSFYHKNCDRLKSEIEDNKSDLKMPFRIRLFYIINDGFILNENEKVEHPEKFISMLLDEKHANQWYDYLQEEATKLKKKDFVTRDEFHVQIKNDKESEEYLKKIEKLESKLENKLKNKHRFYNYWRPVHYTITASIILIFMFLLRYIIYATIWSWNQLNTEKED